ncbi:MAG: hypothetical protein ACHREM_04210 [Polyangiales bacterium]
MSDAEKEARCPACKLPEVSRDRLYLMGVVTGIAMAGAKASLGSFEEGLGNKRFCHAHRQEFAALTVLAQRAMKGERP